MHLREEVLTVTMVASRRLDADLLGEVGLGDRRSTQVVRSSETNDPLGGVNTLSGRGRKARIVLTKPV